MRTILLSAGLAVMALVSGCTNGDHASMTSGSSAPSVTITPKEGATDVRLDAPVTLTFAKPVDRTVTERNLHLFSQKDMDDSTCPMGMSMGQDMMDQAMTDSMMMNHLIAQHNTPGRYQWNGDATTCSFSPDSMMMPDMPYMIHLGREMTQMMEDRMGNMNMMGGHGTGMMSGDMMYHFRTLDTSRTSGGHDGHH